MNGFQYIGLDIHKRTISYCVKTADGKIVEEGRKVASKDKLKSWAEARRQPWVGAMEATLFTHWVYDVLRPYAAELADCPLVDIQTDILKTIHLVGPPDLRL